MQLSSLGRLFLAAASGWILASAFAPDYGRLNSWIAAGILISVLLRTAPAFGFLCGFLHGAVFFAKSLPWIYTITHEKGGASAPEAAGVLALVVLILSLFPAIFGFTIARLSQSSISRASFAAPFVWVMLEFVRNGMPIIGFPWNALGYAVANQLPLLQIVSWTGIYGLSFVVMTFGSAVAWAGATRQRILAAGLLVAAGAIYLAKPSADKWIPTAAGSKSAILVQTNLPQAVSYGADWWERHATDMDELERISIEAGRKSPGLLIWPEVPAPFYFLDWRFAQRAGRIARESGSHFLAGAVEWKPDPNAPPPGPAEMKAPPLRPYNSAVLLSPEGQREFSYDKIHLVAFGEYVPFAQVFSFAGKIVAEISDFQAGSEYRVGRLPGGHHFGTFICFEAIFPDEVRRFTTGGAELLINLSNDGWFGRSAEPEQHLMMARVRAVENRRWLLRATNNGHTVSIDPYGRIVAQLAPDVRGVLVAPYDFRGEQTIYVRFGDWFAWMCVMVAGGFVIWGWKGSRDARKSEIRTLKKPMEVLKRQKSS